MGYSTLFDSQRRCIDERGSTTSGAAYAGGDVIAQKRDTIVLTHQNIVMQTDKF
jgi:hypothetical protein